eukprot:scaffold367775_cov30-Prasinocladus_malaysianus.AAC.1
MLQAPSCAPSMKAKMLPAPQLYYHRAHGNFNANVFCWPALSQRWKVCTGLQCDQGVGCIWRTVITTAGKIIRVAILSQSLSYRVQVRSDKPYCAHFIRPMLLPRAQR